MVHQWKAEAMQTDEFKNLFSKGLCLQNLYLPIPGSRAWLVEKLRLAMNSALAAIQGCSWGRPHNGWSAQRQTFGFKRMHTTVFAAQCLGRTGRRGDLPSNIHSAVKELFKDFKPQVPEDAVFSSAQMSAIQKTMLTSVNKTLWVWRAEKFWWLK